METSDESILLADSIMFSYFLWNSLNHLDNLLLMRYIVLFVHFRIAITIIKICSTSEIILFTVF